MFKNVRIKSFADDGVLFTANEEDVELNGFDMVVISEKHKSIREARKLEKIAGVPFHFIGDAREPRHLMYCISEAEEIARSI